MEERDGIEGNIKKGGQKKSFLSVHTDTKEDFINTDIDAYIDIDRIVMDRFGV